MNSLTEMGASGLQSPTAFAVNRNQAELGLSDIAAVLTDPAKLKRSQINYRTKRCSDELEILGKLPLVLAAGRISGRNIALPVEAGRHRTALIDCYCIGTS
ncbi:hypothetical protein [Mesorhizobium sp. LNJC403B00]|uniref:hypothetical protein n=1 Tax=Mesorhizobium sp. LNJC403B00 TaxID=1287280 RepID=UPI0012EBE6DD|nr:hypothetical protein [Mesorhizobium sp. LNJC403B00]